MSFNPLGMLQDYVKSESIKNRVEDPTKRGEYNASNWDALVGGVLGVDVEGAVDKRTHNDNMDKADRLIAASGYDRATLGIGADVTDDAVIGNAIRRTKQGEQEKKTQGDRTFQEGLVTKQLAPTIAKIEADSTNTAAALKAQIAATNASEKRLNNQMQMQNNLALLQLQDTQAARIADMEYQRSRDRKADQQYNERLDRQDRKDRQAMIAQLFAGIGNLGAAFTI